MLDLIATLGPASLHLAHALQTAGATAFRVNASHLTPDALRAHVEAARARLPGFPVVVDLQGAKLRLGELAPREVREGDTVRFSPSPDDGGALFVPHPELFASARPGDLLRCDDDRLRFEVLLASPSELVTRCEAGGVVRARKGVNLKDHPVELQGLSGFDRACVEATRDLGAVSYAFSFMQTGDEAAWVRALAPGAPVVGKVERREATEGIAALAQRVDALWICRGDLGAQLGPVSLARWVADYRPPTSGPPVWIAGQVFEHLTRHREPTRSEVCHLHDLLSRGYAGVVLSDETAIGDDPAHAVSVVASLGSALLAGLA